MSYDENGTWINEKNTITIGHGEYAFEVNNEVTAKGRLKEIEEKIIEVKALMELDEAELKVSEVTFGINLEENKINWNPLPDQLEQAKLKGSIRLAKKELMELEDEKKLLLRQI